MYMTLDSKEEPNGSTHRKNLHDLILQSGEYPKIKSSQRKAEYKMHPYHPQGKQHIQTVAMRLGKIHKIGDCAFPNMQNCVHSRWSIEPNISPKREKVSIGTEI